MTTAKVVGLATLLGAFTASCSLSDRPDSTEVYLHGHRTTVDLKNHRVIEHDGDKTYTFDSVRHEFCESTTHGFGYAFTFPTTPARECQSTDSVTDLATATHINEMRELLIKEENKFKPATASR